MSITLYAVRFENEDWLNLGRFETLEQAEAEIDARDEAGNWPESFEAIVLSDDRALCLFFADTWEALEASTYDLFISIITNKEQETQECYTGPMEPPEEKGETK